MLFIERDIFDVVMGGGKSEEVRREWFVPPREEEMGQNQSNPPGNGQGDKNGKGQKKKYEPPPAPQRIGLKKKKKGLEGTGKIPAVTPSAKCRLRLLKLERIKDYMLMEEEFVTNQEKFKPHEVKTEEERSRVSFEAYI